MEARKRQRARVNRVFTGLCWVVASISVFVLGVLLFSIATSGAKYLFTRELTFAELKEVEWADVAADAREHLTETEDASALDAIIAFGSIDWVAFDEKERLDSIADFRSIRWTQLSADIVGNADAASLAQLETLSRSHWEAVTSQLRTFDIGAIGHFISSPTSATPEIAGLGPAMMGSIGICFICALFALPLGVGTAVFLEEYQPKSALLRRLHGTIQLNIANLAGVPSIVYGILGLTVFVQFFGVLGSGRDDPAIEFGASYTYQVVDEAGNALLFPIDSRSDRPVLETGDEVQTADGSTIAVRRLSEVEMSVLREQEDAAVMEIPLGGDFERAFDEVRSQLYTGVYPEGDLTGSVLTDKSWYYFRIPFGRSVLAGGLTLMLVILPIVIVSSQEAIRSVPPSLREGAFGLGSTKWQTIQKIVLPSSVPGIMTGSILAISRAIGEAAPILVLAGIVYIAFMPANLMDNFTAMPLQIYNWAGMPNKEFHHVAASGIIILLAVLLTFNAAAVFVRQKFQKPLS